MSALSKVKSGHDIELIAGSDFLRHVFQLLLDTGTLPQQIVTDLLTLNLKAAEPSAVNRTYEAFSGTDYTNTDPSAFEVQTYDFDDVDPEFTYLSVRAVAEIDLKIYLKIKKEINLSSEIQKIIDYVDAPEDESGAPIEPYDILALVRVVGILANGVAFDPESTVTSDILQATVGELNSYLTAFITGLRADETAEVLVFLRSQLEPLTVPLIDSISFKAFPDNHLGIYLNLHLLNHASGFVGGRGNLDDAEDFLPSGEHFAIGTSADFMGHLVDDILIKKNAPNSG